MRYVITLDSDTDLPLDAGRKLVGAIAHPLNRPRFNPRVGRVTEGYGILQPRVSISAVSASRSKFAQVFSGHVGLDPYTTAVSDVYQDLFQEGSYVGKGIYDVDAFERALAGRVPENALLSHDLFEGLFARVALCTDLEVIDDYPGHYLTWTGRLHRWARGDWQLLPLAMVQNTPRRRRTRKERAPDNRTLEGCRQPAAEPPAASAHSAARGRLACVARRAGRVDRHGVSRAFFPAYVQWGQSFTNRIHGVRLGDHLRAERATLVSSLQQVFLTSAFLAHQALVMVDAIGRTLVRLAISRRHLLEWEPAADAAARLEGDWVRVFRRMWTAPALAIALGLLVWTFNPANLLWALPVVALWTTSPVWAYRTGLPRTRRIELDDDQRAELHRTARLTWRFFEELVKPGDNWLIPDNYQEKRPDPIAHRTSPTNIGLQLLAAVSAWDFGYISASQCIDSIERTFATIEKLRRVIAAISSIGTTRKRFCRWRRSMSPPSTAAISSAIC